MMIENLSIKEMFFLVIVALIGGGFSLAIALSIGYISIFKDVPRKIFWLSILVQVGLSLGCFIGAILYFYSSLTPDILSKDLITGAFIAYCASAMPEITFGIVVLIIKILKDKLRKTFHYSIDDAPTPDVKLRSIVDSYYENNIKQQERETKKQEEQNV
ncbi:hypothetical protein [Helicobacter equorum]|uniref:hypothetical protein n=1 Tax=Helicobacter equorum TaxID=361872 RepID=UPI000CF1B151|nr:hypothetical protein [Helicobacter equorum]